MSADNFYIAEQGQNQPDMWYIKDYNVPENCTPIVLASTSSAKYADLIVNALNAQAELKASTPMK